MPDVRAAYDGFSLRWFSDVDPTSLVQVLQDWRYLNISRKLLRDLRTTTHRSLCSRFQVPLGLQRFVFVCAEQLEEDPSSVDLHVSVPQHKHDCSECEFLGSVSGSDLYYCSANSVFVIRTGSRDDAYYTFPVSRAAESGPVGAVAYRRWDLTR